MPDASLVQDFGTIYCASPIASSRAIELLQTAASPIPSPGRTFSEKELWRKKVTGAMTFSVLVIRRFLGTVSIQSCDGAGDKVINFIQLSCFLSDYASTPGRNQRLLFSYQIFSFS
jgi:hypothetical protein